MNPIQKMVEQFQTVILDGAIATEIERAGVNIKHPLWSALAVKENPEAVKHVHTNYFEAGADLATTNTYQASMDGFREQGWEEKDAEKTVQKTVQLAIEARNQFWNRLSNDEKTNRPFPLVAGSVGPYGAYLANGAEYTGDYQLTEEQYTHFHLRRMQLIKKAKADLFFIETIPSFKEAQALANILQTHFPDDYALLSFSITDASHISDGTPLLEAVSFFNKHPSICAIGINCTGLEPISDAIKILKTATSKPLLVYPNAGGMYDAQTKTWTVSHETVDYASLTTTWHQNGLSLIGGCCGTTPEHIRQIREWARKKPYKESKNQPF